MSIQYKGYTGTVDYNADDKILHGRVLGVRGTIIYEGKSVDELEKDFRGAIEEYLQFCTDSGVEPEKPYSGNYALRMPKEMHRRASEAAAVKGESLNQWIVDAIATQIPDLEETEVKSKRARRKTG